MRVCSGRDFREQANTTRHPWLGWARARAIIRNPTLHLHYTRSKQASWALGLERAGLKPRVQLKKVQILISSYSTIHGIVPEMQDMLEAPLMQHNTNRLIQQMIANAVHEMA